MTKGEIKMDNNENNQSSDSSYSYNFTHNNQNENNIWRASENSAGQQETGNSWSGNAGGAYSNTYTAYEDPGKKRRPKKEKRERRPGGFGTKLVKCAAIALVFGLVAGSVFTGTNYALGRMTGTTTASGGVSGNGSTTALTQEAESKVDVTDVSNATDRKSVV